MWVAKITYDGSKSIIGSRTFKHKINLFGFPLSYYYEKEWIIVNVVGTIFGERKNKRAFFRDWKKSKRLINLELNEDFVIATIKEPIIAKNFYNKNIIHLAPVLINDKAQEIMTIGSFNKKYLEKSISALERLNKVKIYYIQQKKIKNISLFKQNPELTEKQRLAMELAIKKGYYNSPRKTSVQKLAKLSGLSFSTFQVHLRKAEEKLIPFFYE